MKFIVQIALLILLVTACGTKKNANKKENTPLHSSVSFPYIETFHNGMRLKLKGEVDEAIEAFMRCLTLRQDDDAVYYALSQLYLQKNQNAQAISMVEKAYSLDAKNIWYAEQIAKLYYQENQFDKASGYFKKLVEYEPKNLEWLYGYGDCLLKQGKVEEAINVINKAEIVLGKNPSLSLEKFNLFISIKKEKEALLELESILKEYPKEPQVIATLVDYYFTKGDINKGVDFLKQLVEADPDNGRAHLALGEVYRKKGKIDDAFEQYKEGFKCEDIDIDTKMGLLISFQSTPLEKHKDAMKLAEMMVDAHPESAKSQSIMGDFLLAQDKEDEALKYYKRALVFEKNQFPIWNQVMVLEYQYLLWDDLYVDSKECLSFFPTMPIVYLLHGVSSNQLKKSQEAIDVLLAGKALVVNDNKIEAEFLGQLGEAYFNAKNINEAKKYYESAIKMDAKSNLLKNNYAYRLAMNKIDFDLALSLINQSISNSPNQAGYYDTRGLIYFNQGKYSQAQDDFNEAIKIDNKSPLYFEHLGDAQSKLNQKDKALESWQKAVELGSTRDILKKKITAQTYYEEVD
ncbi:MAG: tetratricopeptide repeat protein [Crocinitomicaceae bacterium]|nr:tetratricopeptide repeat protein [Crocinitomicaceae bacterium]